MRKLSAAISILYVHGILTRAERDKARRRLERKTSVPAALQEAGDG